MNLHSSSSIIYCYIKRNILLWFAIHQWCTLTQPMQFSRKLHWVSQILTLIRLFFSLQKVTRVLRMIQSTTVILSHTMDHALFGKMVLQNTCNSHCTDNIHLIQCITAPPAAWRSSKTSETRKWVASVRFLIAKDDIKQKDVNHMV